MLQVIDRPLRVGYVVSYFHPFASGAERQALAQGSELVRRGHTVHVITKAVPGYPVHDEEYQGLYIHRWVRTSSRGPLFALSFVSGVIRAIRRLRSELDVVHTHQGLWEAVATGLAHPRRPGSGSGIPTLVQPASSGYYGEADELSRTRGSSLWRALILRNTAFAAISAEIERQWLHLGVPEGRLIRMTSGVDADHFRPGSSTIESRLLPRPRVLFTGRLHPQKNLPLLLEAWTEVARRTPANLILLGPGDDRQALAETRRRAWCLRSHSDPGRGSRPGRLPASGRPFRPAQRGGGHEQFTSGSDGHGLALRRFRHRRQHRPDLRRPERAAGSDCLSRSMVKGLDGAA